MEPWSSEWKEQRLFDLYESWKDCERCPLHKTRQNVVFGDGNIDADVMFIGEGPGKKENERGLCFVGESGDLLFNSILASIDVKREEVFVTNIVGCRTSESNRDPTAKEKDACILRVHQLIYLIDPLVIVTVGKYAMNALTGGRQKGIEKEHGNLFSTPHPSIRVMGERNGIEIPGVVFPRKGDSKNVHYLSYDMVPIYHPAYILRQDSYDPKTDKFSAGGIAYQTFKDLESVFELTRQIKTEYAAIQRSIGS